MEGTPKPSEPKKGKYMAKKSNAVGRIAKKRSPESKSFFKERKKNNALALQTIWGEQQGFKNVMPRQRERRNI